MKTYQQIYEEVYQEMWSLQGDVPYTDDHEEAAKRYARQAVEAQIEICAQSAAAYMSENEWGENIPVPSRGSILNCPRVELP